MLLGNRQDVQAIRSAAAETLLKVATLRSFESLAERPRETAGREAARDGRLEEAPVHTMLYTCVVRAFIGIGVCLGSRPKALNFKTEAFETVVTPSPES